MAPLKKPVMSLKNSDLAEIYLISQPCDSPVMPNSKAPSICV